MFYVELFVSVKFFSSLEFLCHLFPDCDSGFQSSKGSQVVEVEVFNLFTVMEFEKVG